MFYQTILAAVIIIIMRRRRRRIINDLYSAKKSIAKCSELEKRIAIKSR